MRLARELGSPHASRTTGSRAATPKGAGDLRHEREETAARAYARSEAFGFAAVEQGFSTMRRTKRPSPAVFNAWLD